MLFIELFWRDTDYYFSMSEMSSLRSSEQMFYLIDTRERFKIHNHQTLWCRFKVNILNFVLMFTFVGLLMALLVGVLAALLVRHFDGNLTITLLKKKTWECGTIMLQVWCDGPRVWGSIRGKRSVKEVIPYIRKKSCFNPPNIWLF